MGVEPMSIGGRSPGWAAKLDLSFDLRGARTVLAKRRHTGPLLVQRPFYPEKEEVCHCYILHPPGGVAGGDALAVQSHIGAGAWALLTTPAAGKFYRSSGPTASLNQVFRVEEGARLEWLPQENILFEGSSSHLKTHVDLAEGAAFMGWEVTCLGRPACGEQWQRGTFRQDLTILRDGVPLIVESLALDPRDRQLTDRAGLGNEPVLGTLFATPADPASEEQARVALRDHGSHFGITRLDEVLVVRFLGPDTGEAWSGFTKVWEALRPMVMGAPATPPRVWST